MVEENCEGWWSKRFERNDGQRELRGMMVKEGGEEWWSKEEFSEHRQLKPESLSLIPRDFWLYINVAYFASYNRIHL